MGCYSQADISERRRKKSSLKAKQKCEITMAFIEATIIKSLFYAYTVPNQIMC